MRFFRSAWVFVLAACCWPASILDFEMPVPTGSHGIREWARALLQWNRLSEEERYLLAWEYAAKGNSEDARLVVSGILRKNRLHPRARALSLYLDLYHEQPLTWSPGTRDMTGSETAVLASNSEMLRAAEDLLIGDDLQAVHKLELALTMLAPYEKRAEVKVHASRIRAELDAVRTRRTLAGLAGAQGGKP